MAAQASEAVNEAYNRLVVKSQEPELREYYEAREMWIIDQAIRETEARKEGKEEGIEEGIEEGKQIGKQEGKREGKEEERVEIAKNLVALGMDDELIMKATCLDMPTLVRIKKSFE